MLTHLVISIPEAQAEPPWWKYKIYKYCTKFIVIPKILYSIQFTGYKYNERNSYELHDM